MKDEIDEILQYAVNHAYEVMDSKSFEDPFTKAKQAILALKKKWEDEKELSSLKHVLQDNGYKNDAQFTFINIKDRINQLTNGDK